MTHDKWTCPRCGHREFEAGELRASSGALASVFDVENLRFTTVTCARCTYTELYKVKVNTLDNVLDLIVT